MKINLNSKKLLGFRLLSDDAINGKQDCKTGGKFGMKRGSFAGAKSTGR